ncbi:MAG: hypothetical protein IT436_12620 [Phycisphaerales bacterium]|nr:hypothetical protein [Phycisphaerales bacterium]
MRKPNRAVVIAALALGLVSGAVGPSGCASAPQKVDYARAYPKELQQVGTLDIQVVRETTEIEFTNTTSNSFGPCTLWLNRRFSHPLEGLKIGQTMRMALRDFRDEYSDPFRAGGFFATELPERLVLAQLEVAGDDGQMLLLGLIVVAREND